jgi:tetratricopeptide (TPR) repeat protein
MRLYPALSAALIGTSIVIIQTRVVVALSTEQIRQIAKDVTVRIEDNDSGWGSGVILKQDGETYYVITNFHVIKDKSKYTLIAPDRERYPINYSNIKKGGLVDLAVVQFNSRKPYKTAKIGNSDFLKIGTPTYISGFTKNNLGYEFRFRKGEVIANSSQLYDYGLVYTNNTLKGMSGGAVFNQNGELIAINGLGETNRFYNHQESIITGNARGITINTILKLKLLDLQTDFSLESASITPQADDYYQLGLNKQKELNFEEAIAAYDEAISLKPDYSYAYYKRGYMYYQRQKYSAALIDFNEVEKLGIKHPDLYNYRGVTKDELKDYEGAITDFTQAMKLDPQYHYAYSNRGDVYQKLTRYAEAVKDYTEAIRLNDRESSLYISRGNAYYNSSYEGGQKALADYTKAIALDRFSSAGYYNRGNVYRRLQQYNRAVSDYNKAIEIKYDYADAYYNRGLTWQDLSNYEKAASDFTRYITLKPQDAYGYSNRANSYQKQKLYNLAIQDYTKAIDLNRQSKLYYRDRAGAYYEAGQIDAAIADWRIDRKEYTEDWNAKTDLAIAVALYHQGKKAEALQLAKSAVKKRSYLTDWNTIKTFGWGDRLLQDTQYFFQDPTIKASIPNNLPKITKKRQINFTSTFPAPNRLVVPNKRPRAGVRSIFQIPPRPQPNQFPKLPSRKKPPLPTIPVTPNQIEPILPKE